MQVISWKIMRHKAEQRASLIENLGETVVFVQITYQITFSLYKKYLGLLTFNAAIYFPHTSILQPINYNLVSRE